MRLAGLGGLVAKAVDEDHHVLALVFLLLLELDGERLLLAALALEAVVVTLVESELAALEMQDEADGLVQQVAVMADQHDGVRIVADEALEPDGAFEVEVVGGFIEQQHVGLGEKGGSQRHAHAPAAGEGRAWPLLGLVGKAEAAQDGGGTGLGRMRVHVGKAGLDVGDAVRVRGGFGLGGEGLEFSIACHHGLEQGFGPTRCLLGHRSDPGIAGQGDGTGLQWELPQDQLEERRLADAIAADDAHLVAFRHCDGGVFQQQTAADPVGQSIDVQHGARLVAAGAANVMYLRPEVPKCR